MKEWNDDDDDDVDGGPSVCVPSASSLCPKLDDFGIFCIF